MTEKSQLKQIQELELSIKALSATVTELRELAAVTDDPRLRANLNDTANGTQASMEKMVSALKAMRQSIQ